MLVPRLAERCIVCLSAPPFPYGFGFTEEHVIPAALGGILTCEFLCKRCNDGFGTSFEANARTDPAIRLAIHHLRAKLPKLHASIERGQPYKIKTEIGHVPGFFRDGEIRGLSKRLEDGSLMASPDDTQATIRGMLRKRGESDKSINGALEKLEAAPEETEIELAPDLFVIKRIAFDGGPDFTKGQSLSTLVPLKVAYEFAALSFGSPVLADAPPLNEIRRALLVRDEASPVYRVDPLFARERKYEPFHGIAFEGNQPHATIQVRLFGYLAYRVHFPNLRVDHKPFGYLHELDTGTERLDYRD